MPYNKNYENIIQDLKGLLRIPSVMGNPEKGKPFGKETFAALEYMLELGKSFGFKVKNVDGYAGHIEWGKGDSLFGVLCHLDVVPAGEGWLHPPFGAEEDGGRIYARGALDDKSPAVAVLYAVKRLKEEGFVPTKKKFRLIMGLNEESGWKCIDYYFSKEKMPDAGFSPDADFPVINREKGVLFLRLKTKRCDDKLTALEGGNRVNMVPDSAYYVYDGVKKAFSGISAHGSTPHKGVNAITKMLEDLKDKTNDCAVQSLYDIFCSDCLKKTGLDLSDEISGKLTLNPGLIELKGEDIFLSIDIRFPVTFTKEQILQRLEKNLQKAFSYEILNYHKPLHIPENDPLVTALLEAYQKVTGEKGGCIGIGGATYSRALDKCVAFGPAFPDEDIKIHTAEESIVTENLYKITDIYYEALKRLLL
jgi:succinyl-diaminopimelate desuccinylase